MGIKNWTYYSFARAPLSGRQGDVCPARSSHMTCNVSSSQVSNELPKTDGQDTVTVRNGGSAEKCPCGDTQWGGEGSQSHIIMYCTVLGIKTTSGRSRQRTRQRTQQRTDLMMKKNAPHADASFGPEQVRERLSSRDRQQFFEARCRNTA
jgi:hypothetical protein